MKLHKMSSTTTALVSMDNSFVGLMRVIVSFVAVFELQYGVKFMQACTRDILNDMIPLSYLHTHSRASYFAISEAGTAFSRSNEFLPPLERLKIEFER